MRRVGFVITTPTFGGPHNQALRLHRLLLELGWEQLVITTSEPGNGASRLEEGGVPVRRIRLHRLRRGPTYWKRAGSLVHILQDIPALMELFRQEKIDVVQFAGVQNLHVGVSGRRAGIPVVMQLLGTFAPRWMRRTMSPLACRVIDVVMSVGMTVAREHPGVTGRKQPLLFFYPPVDVEALRVHAGGRDIARERLGIPGGRVAIVTLGHFVPVKAHETLVQAATLLREHGPSSLCFRILGSEVHGHEGYYSARVVALARRNRLLHNGFLRFVDAGTRAHELLAAGDIFVLSSVAEGIPTAMLEAMALGMPVVATSVGSVEEVLEEAKAGICVPPRRPDLLAAAIRRLVEDEGKRKTMSENALAFARGRLDVRGCAGIHAQAYELALKQARG